MGAKNIQEALTTAGTATGLTLDLNGAGTIIMDADADTTIRSSAANQIDIKVANADDFTITANTLTALSGSTIATNTIAETTANTGVTIDSLVVKDGGLTAGATAVVDAGKMLVADAINLVDSEPIYFGTGTDMIVNGAFATDTDWTKGAGWTIADGVATATGAISTALTATAAPLTASTTYRVTYTVVSCSAGTITATCGTQAGTARSVTGTFSENILANGTAFEFATAGFTGSIDNVSATLADVKLGWDGSGLDVKVAGASDFQVTANTLTALAGSTIATNTIAETTANTGVTIDGLIVKDSGLTAGATSVVDAGQMLVADAINLVDSEPIYFGTGTDVIVNGVFAADTDWTKGAGWTIADGIATATGAISTTLTQTAAPLTSAKVYRVTYTVLTCTAGTITATCGTQAGTARSVSGTFTENILANGTAFEFATAGFTGTIDNVSATLADVSVQWNGSALAIAVDGATDLTVTANSLNVPTGSCIDLVDSAPIKFGTSDDVEVSYDGTNNILVVGPATGLWAGCPSPADPDPYKRIEVFDDFIRGGISATAPVPTWDYISDGGTGTPVFRTDIVGGVLDLPTAAADNDYHAIATPGTCFDLLAAKALWFEARFRLAEATTNESAWWFGLTSDLTTGGFQANTGGPLATYDGVMVWKDEASMDILSETSNAGTQLTNTTMGTFVTNTWTRVGFFVSGAETTAVVTWYTDLDGTGPLSAFGTPQNLTRAGLVPLYLVAGVKAGPTAAAETLQIDYLKCVQIR